jgi:outer membrane receptor protein involved in Fe transport
MKLKLPYLVALLFGAMGSLTGAAQTITGGVTGTVTDPSGAIIVGAKVTAMNVSTNIATTTKSNHDGVYSVQFLTIGRYTVTVDAPGFNSATLGPFTLEAGQVAKFDAKLVVRGQASSVSVNEGLVPLLNTENAELGTTLDATAIDSIPLQDRNFAALALFTPGAISTNPASMTGGEATERDTIGGSVTSVNGNRAQTNNYLLDGIEINETVNNDIGYNPSPDALSQVRVVSANAQAEYGNVNGGDVIALLKNGTNVFHGSAFYYVNDYKLDANSWSNDYAVPIVPKTSATSNIFGGTLGGPIIKDKLFFFADYSGNRYHSGGIGLASVVDQKMRQGDFSELLDPQIMCGGTCSGNHKTIQLYDPTNGYAPFNNNQVPLTNPVAIFLYSHPNVYPLPNQTPSLYSPVANNYVGPTKSRIYNDQFDVRLDYKLSDKDSFFGSYSQSVAGNTQTSPLVITFPGASTYPTRGFSINSIHTFTPNLLNELRVGFFRIVWAQGVPLDTTGVFGANGDSVVGIQGGNQAPGFAQQSVGAVTAVGNSATYSDNVMNNFTYGDNLTWQKGRHNFKFGGQLIRYQQQIIYSGVSGAEGSMSYTGNFTSDPMIGAAGYGIADFNLDRVYSSGRGAVAGYAGQRQWRDAAFAQDDWKLFPNLTLNLGVRWEWDQPIYEVHNKQSNLNMQTGAIEIAGQDGNSRALYNSVWTNFMPRIGFSYNPVPRFVLRGGFGSTIFMEGTGANLRLIINPPFQTSITWTGAPPTSLTNTGTYASAETAFSANSAACPYATNPSCGQTFREWDPNLRPSTVNEFSLTTEYQLSNTASFQVGYVGETGVHLISANNGNQISAPCFSGSTMLAYNSAACFAVNKAPFYQLVGQSGLVRITGSEGMMNYNALQATFRQRLSHGLQATANYTYSKAMTNATGFFGSNLNITNNTSFPEDPRNRSPEYGPAPTDSTHSVNFQMVYSLPFGRDQRFGSKMNRAFDEVAGGWRMSMSGFAYTGFPVTLISSTNNSGVNSPQQRAIHYRHLVVRNRSLTNWFGTDPSATACTTPGVDNGVCAYGIPAPGTISPGHPFSERVPGYQQYDAAAFKEFATVREQSLMFRVEAFNVFNIASYNNPVATVGVNTFGLITSTRSEPRTVQLSARYKF